MGRTLLLLVAFEKVTFALDPKREGLLHNKGICTEATLRSSRPDAWLKMLKKPLLKRGHSWPFVGGLPLVFVLGLGCTNFLRGEAFWNFAIPPQDVLSQLVFSGLVATLLRRRRPMEPSSGTAHDRTDQHKHCPRFPPSHRHFSHVRSTTAEAQLAGNIFVTQVIETPANPEILNRAI